MKHLTSFLFIALVIVCFLISGQYAFAIPKAKLATSEILPERETITYSPVPIDSLFLGFRLGMSRTDFLIHVGELATNGKLDFNYGFAKYSMYFDDENDLLKEVSVRLNYIFKSDTLYELWGYFKYKYVSNSRDILWSRLALYLIDELGSVSEKTATEGTKLSSYKWRNNGFEFDLTPGKNENEGCLISYSRRSK